MKKTIRLDVNGEIYEPSVEPYETLLSVIRNKIGLTGTKKGCARGECGACTVLMDGKIINSCLYPAMRAEGKKIITIEGLLNGTRLHTLQEAFIKYGAIQCGFCTPGMILSAKALLDENPKPTENEVREAIVGNLCRCTGYAKIVEAILAASSQNKKE